MDAKYSLSRLGDHELARGLRALVAQSCGTTALLLAHVGEFRARRLYAPAGYPSMSAYCVGELGASEDSAYKWIRAAQAARRFPTIFEHVADGRLHLSGLVLLAPKLTRENRAGLLAAACGRTLAGIRLLLAERFPQADLEPQVAAVAMTPTTSPTTGSEAFSHRPLDLNPVVPSSVEPGPKVAPPVHPHVAPLAPRRYALQLTLSETAHEQLRRAQELSGRTGAGQLPELIEAALAAYVAQLEKRRCGTAANPRRRRSPGDGRRVPNAVRSEVWKRDEGRCTFVSDRGRRCDARAHLEFDHVTPVARGGRSTAGNLRLRCRAHNQYEAGRVFGEKFMEGRREAARAKRGVERREAPGADLVPALRNLGCSGEEARRVAAIAGDAASAPLEVRMRVALQQLRPHCTHVPAPANAPPASPAPGALPAPGS